MKDRKIQTSGRSLSPRQGGKCRRLNDTLFRGSVPRITLIWVAWGVAVASLLWIVASVYRLAGA